MHQPYIVPVNEIRWGGRPSGGELRKGNGLGRGIVFGGDWDIRDKRDIEKYLSDYIYSRTVYQIFRDGMKPEDSDQFKEMMGLIEEGNYDVWQARGCRDENEVIDYFKQLEMVYTKIRDKGYQTQTQLGSDSWYDEIKVFVDRNGEIHKQQAAGHHRLAMVRLLNVKTVPVVVLGVHRDWALNVQREFNTDVLTAIDKSLLAKAPH